MKMNNIRTASRGKRNAAALAAVLLAAVLILTACFDAAGRNNEDTGKSAADQVAEYHGKNPWEENQQNKENTEEPETDGKPAETEQEKVTDPHVPETQPVVTEPVTEPETEPVTEPVTEPETEPVTEPVVEPKPVNPSGLPVIRTAFPANGKISSAQSKNIVLNAAYDIERNADGSLTATVKVYLSSYEIYAGVRKDSGLLKVNDEEVIFSTPELSSEDRVMKDFPFLTRTFTLPAGTGSVDISAMWLFNGTYGGANISALTLGASVQPE